MHCRLAATAKCSESALQTYKPWPLVTNGDDTIVRPLKCCLVIDTYQLMQFSNLKFTADTVDAIYINLTGSSSNVCANRGMQ